VCSDHAVECSVIFASRLLAVTKILDARTRTWVDALAFRPGSTLGRRSGSFAAVGRLVLVTQISSINSDTPDAGFPRLRYPTTNAANTTTATWLA